MPDLCCLVTLRLVASVGRAFGPVVCPAIYVYIVVCEQCYGHATNLIWLLQSLSVTTNRIYTAKRSI